MVELIGVPVGARLRVVGGITAQIVACIDDEWVRVRLLTVPEGTSGVGTEELCHATDVLEILPA